MNRHTGHVLITHPSGRQEAIPMRGGSLRVGSAANNDVVLVGAGIAPQHASIRCDDFGDVLITVAGMEIELPCASAGTAVLRIGGYVLNYAAGAAVDHSNEYVMRQSRRPTQYARVDEAELLSALLAYDAWPDSDPQAGSAHEAITIEMQAFSLDRAGDE